MEKLEEKVGNVKIQKSLGENSSSSSYKNKKVNSYGKSFSPEYTIVEGRFDANPLTCRSCRCYPH